MNVLAGGGTLFSVATLEGVGVKRISVGSALARAALGAFLTAAREMRNRGTFSWAKKAVDYAEINGMFGGVFARDPQTSAQAATLSEGSVTPAGGAVPSTASSRAETERPDR